ncbi:MAG TPA: GtrA family protein [Chloroflexota bacterium]
MKFRLGSLTRPELVRIARFGCVGLIGVAVNSALLWLLTDRVHLYYLASSVVATEVAILSNFALNQRWTFASINDGRPWVEKLMKFNVVSFSGLVVTVSILFVLKQFAGLNYLVANTLAVGTAATWNYAANRRWTWTA